MSFIRRASPQSGQGAVGWMGVRSLVQGGRWKGNGEAGGGRSLRGPLRERRRWNNRQRALDFYLAAWGTAGRRQRLYQCHTRAGISNETVCKLQKMHPKPQAKEYSEFEHS